MPSLFNDFIPESNTHINVPSFFRILYSDEYVGPFAKHRSQSSSALGKSGGYTAPTAEPPLISMNSSYVYPNILGNPSLT